MCTLFYINVLNPTDILKFATHERSILWRCDDRSFFVTGKRN